MVSIVDPTGRRESIGEVAFEDGAVATSGQYERYRGIEGRVWGHILNPRTGRPCSRLLSVTVMAEEALMADALATAGFVLGIEGAAKLIEAIPGCEAVLVGPGEDGESQVRFTTGLGDR